MIEDDINGFKELAESIQKNTEEAFLIYEVQVDRIYRNMIKDEKEIERVIDALLDYCYDDKMLLLFKRLCRYYYEINPIATYEYVNIYRELWDEEPLDEK
ncbi:MULTISPECIES: hypothetical protein [unclassified Flavobacterium]|jgi:hypothetical protein|uniref:hypothetical protein n=1 Tax=unclassified Flavobacterium TaxID=196869 RepID=UPI0025B88BAC|nr:MULTISPECIES: hypothetical protein [unclassified Flavobacterium]